MNSIKKIAVIGGTGKAGKYLVKELLDLNIPIKILVRNPENFQVKNSLAEVVEGNVRDYDTVHSLLDGCDAIISTLGMGQPPSETSIFTKATNNVIHAMNELNIKRYIVITGLNVDSPFDNKGLKTKFATEWMYTNYPESTADKQKEYDILAESNVDWTLVRLPMIEQTDARSRVIVNKEDCPGDRISATDLADFLIKQLSDDTYIKQAPFIANT